MVNIRMESIDLDYLTLMTIHADDRWRTRDLHRIQRDGMKNPIAVWKCTLDEYNRQRRYQRNLPNAKVVDGYVYAVKFGNNRVQVAKHLGWQTIQAEVFTNHHDAVIFGMKLREW